MRGINEFAKIKVDIALNKTVRQIKYSKCERQLAKGDI